MNQHAHSGQTERSTDWLSGAGLRPTRQRMALAGLLVGDGRDRHVTAESLFDAAANTGERCLWQRFTIPCARFAMRGFCERSRWMDRKVILTPI